MKTQQGFSLIELAIVLVIVTLLIGGLAMPLSAQIQARRIAETRSEMNATRDGLLGFAMSNVCSISCTPPNCASAIPASTSCQNACNTYCSTTPPPTQLSITRHYFPCPDINGDGREDRDTPSGTCTNASTTSRGGLPWLTIGVKGHDAWGNRFTYAVTPAFAAHSGFKSASPETGAEIDVFSDRTCVSPSVAENIPFVIISHGPNGSGATNMNGGTALVASSVALNERQNLNVAPPDLTCALSSHDFTHKSFVYQNPNETFDDLLVWVAPGEVFTRICPAGGCP